MLVTFNQKKQFGDQHFMQIKSEQYIYLSFSTLICYEETLPCPFEEMPHVTSVESGLTRGVISAHGSFTFYHQREIIKKNILGTLVHCW